jgi:hypothetical protein
VGSPPPPVAPSHPQWDLQTLAEKEFVSRFGLALTRDTPNILSVNKIERFFNTSFFNDTDYRNKLLFSSYQYGYNISLQNISPMKPGDYPNGLVKMLGEPYPAGYGYIRRYVVIKQNSDAAVNLSTYAVHGVRYPFIATREDQVDLHVTADHSDDAHQQFVIRLDNLILYNKTVDTPLKIDLQREPLSIRITNLSSCLNNTAKINGPTALANSSAQWNLNTAPKYIASGEWKAPTNATLTSVTFTDPTTGDDWTNFIRGVNLTVDGDVGGYGHVDWANPLPSNVFVNNTIELYVPNTDPYFLNEGRPLAVTFTFQDKLPHILVSGTLWYDYNSLNVTQPVLSTGMMEVAIW